ncbi:MAG: helix-turn-helix domain-containing protein, partial [Clostridia bacterium]|nr:helix-turn-helix domain-containing protein [Clostridia bacterium]
MNYFESIYAAGLPNRAISVYFYLVQRANSDGKCWPSERKIAMDLSMSRSTVK